MEQLRDAFHSHHGTDLILARMRGRFGKTKGATEEDFFSCPIRCTTLGEEYNPAELVNVGCVTDVVTGRNFVARFPPLGYTEILLSQYEFSQQETLLCRSAHSNPTAAAAPRAATRSQYPQASATSFFAAFPDAKASYFSGTRV